MYLPQVRKAAFRKRSALNAVSHRLMKMPPPLNPRDQIKIITANQTEANTQVSIASNRGGYAFITHESPRSVMTTRCGVPLGSLVSSLAGAC